MYEHGPVRFKDCIPHKGQRWVGGLYNISMRQGTEMLGFMASAHHHIIARLHPIGAQVWEYIPRIFQTCPAPWKASKAGIIVWNDSANFKRSLARAARNNAANRSPHSTATYAPTPIPPSSTRFSSHPPVETSQSPILSFTFPMLSSRAFLHWS